MLLDQAGTGKLHCLKKFLIKHNTINIELKVLSVTAKSGLICTSSGINFSLG